jgi:hypothetical protein
MNNDFKNDTQLLFASSTLQQLHARVEPTERHDYLLTFGPPRGEGANTEEGEPEHPAAHMGWRQYTLTCLAGGCRGGRRLRKGRAGARSSRQDRACAEQARGAHTLACLAGGLKKSSGAACHLRPLTVGAFVQVCRVAPVRRLGCARHPRPISSAPLSLTPTPTVPMRHPCSRHPAYADGRGCTRERPAAGPPRCGHKPQLPPHQVMRWRAERRGARARRLAM